MGPAPVMSTHLISDVKLRNKYLRSNQMGRADTKPPSCSGLNMLPLEEQLVTLAQFLEPPARRRRELLWALHTQLQLWKIVIFLKQITNCTA